MKLIIGLGNPGKKYEHTRHNIGWDAVEHCLSVVGLTGKKFTENKKFQSEVAEAIVDGEKVLFVHPLTFMNESGRAVLALKQFYKLDIADMLIVHDDMDFAVGEMAFTKKAGDAGHHGVASIQEIFDTTTIPRLRLGIGRPVASIPKEDFVLQKFPVDEKDIVKKTIHSAISAIKDWTILGIDKAMNKWNGV
ncbi:MAG: aminoacyl-tRNA hydrolase [Candidatus Uhrbacteria bacterium]|nr:aminoacyl-tRNA hydrolase [Candidatus Uhrbacteria bacterium]